MAIVDRFTVRAKPGRVEDLAAQSKHNWEAAGAPCCRVYICTMGLRSKVVVDLEFKDPAQRIEFWQKFDARPEFAEVMAKFYELMENDMISEVYRLL